MSLKDKMLIKTKFYNGEEIELNIEPTDTLNSISREIERKTGIPRRLHELYGPTGYMHINDTTAEDNKIYDGAVLNFRLADGGGWRLCEGPGFKIIKRPSAANIEIPAPTKPNPGSVSVSRAYENILHEEEGNESTVFGMISVDRIRYPPDEQRNRSKMEIWVTVMLMPEHHELNWEVSIILVDEDPSFPGVHRLGDQGNLSDGNGRFKLHVVRREINQEKPARLSVCVGSRGDKAQFRDEFIANATRVMDGLYKERESSGDVKITSTTGTQFPVHSAVLAQHSRMFQAAFEQEMKEKQEKSVKLDGYTDKAIESLVQFLYTGWTPAIVEETFEMLKMAHMYQVQRLVDACWDQVMNSLSVETVFDSLIMAELLDAKEHLNDFARYMMENHEEIRNLPAFGKFVVENAHLYVKVCQMKTQVSDLFCY